MAAASAAPSRIHTENGCSSNVFDCLQHLWEWFDPQQQHCSFQMENKKPPATQQPLQQHHVAQHVHPGEQIFAHQHPQLTQLSSPQPGQLQLQQNGTALPTQYHPGADARSPLLENRHELYGTGYNHDYARHYGPNENYNYPQSPPRQERADYRTDHNVNHELLQNMPKGYNAEVYQDYLKRNPPKDTNQIYQNHQPTQAANANQYGSKPYLPYTNKVTPQSNTEMLRRQYNEIQQMKLQQQMLYQNQAQMHQQQKFAERQLLLQQIHGVQPPPNLQNSIYSDGSYRDLDRYNSRSDFKDYPISPQSRSDYKDYLGSPNSRSDYPVSPSDIQKEVDQLAINNEFREVEKYSRHNQVDNQWQANKPTDYREVDRYRRPSECDKGNIQSPPQESPNQPQKNNVGMVSPMKSSESSSPSIKSPSIESRRGNGQALRSPTAQRSPSAPVTMSGILYKQGSDGLKVWRKRWFVLAEFCLFYYKGQEEEKLLGSVLLPSYKVSPCTAEDKVLRKYAFKLEHANMRTYVLAAPDLEAMTKWVKALTLATIMQKYTELPLKQPERAPAKLDENDDVPGPTYVNAPPKPRRSNDGYNSPSPDIYDPNYDLLKKPASQYSQGARDIRQDNTTYKTNTKGESVYGRNTGPPLQQSHQKQQYDPNTISMSYPSSMLEKQEMNPSTSAAFRNHPQHLYLDNLNPQIQQKQPQKEQIYDSKPRASNPFLQETPVEERQMLDREQFKLQNDISPEFQGIPSNRVLYGENNSKPHRSANPGLNERSLIDRRTPDAYGRSIASGNRNKLGDYEDVYGIYDRQNGETQGRLEYGQQNVPHQRREEKPFTGPAVLRRKKQEANLLQSPVCRPHSADFLEYQSKQELLNQTMPARAINEPPKQPPRPKSSLDINSFYDPSSDRYYSEESYAEKMRKSAQYLQQGAPTKNMQIPLAQYASGLAEKQIQSSYSQNINNNYETEFRSRRAQSRENINHTSKYIDVEGMNSNWTLKEKAEAREFLNRSGSVKGDLKDAVMYDASTDRFLRTSSARLPSAPSEKEGEKKGEQREESMKRLLEWKQRMLQSPLTRKSNPATSSLARTLNQNRQHLRPDQYKPKNYANAPYNNYSSDDEEETSGTDLQMSREKQAGRSQKENLASPTLLRPVTPHTPSITSTSVNMNDNEISNVEEPKIMYENMIILPDVEENPLVKIEVEDAYENVMIAEQEHKNDEHESIVEDYESNDSEAESETQLEYTDNDLDEVLMESEQETENSTDILDNNEDSVKELCDEPSTPPAGLSEDHYLPMSPRKTSDVEPAHKTILDNLSVLENMLPHNCEDNPYVEMNLGSEEDDLQTYEIVCVNNGILEPVYMELTHCTSANKLNDDEKSNTSTLKSSDIATTFADTQSHTLKRKKDKKSKSKLNKLAKSVDDLNQQHMSPRSDCSDADDESSKDISQEQPFSRFSISDSFRPASYYLGGSMNTLHRKDKSDTELTSSPSIPTSTLPSSDLTDEALSRYVQSKLNESCLSQDNSILKMLTTENQNMNNVKKKTSLMIYGSKTSIHDTLSRGEKVRNSRASLNDRNKINESQSSLLSSSILECHNSSRSIETDSLVSYNADRGSSQLSSESDISNKFENFSSRCSPDVNSLNGSDIGFEFRNSSSYNDIAASLKRRPLSDDSFFELISETPLETNDTTDNIDLDSYLGNLEPLPLPVTCDYNPRASGASFSNSEEKVTYKDNVVKAAQLRTVNHVRSSSTPVTQSRKTCSTESQECNLVDETSGYMGSQSSCSTSNPKMSYYCKNHDEEKLLNKNLNKQDKLNKFEREKCLLTSEHENASPRTAGFHSRESSTEQSAPYYYSDLSSQEHINILPTSHFLKNTNIHRKLNNQRRRGPLHKKNEISHIHNPIHNHKMFMSDDSCDLVAATRSISVEFLTAADKDPEIDLKNIYESTSFRNSKIPESMRLLSGYGCKSTSHLEGSSPECSNNNVHSQVNSSIKASTTSMSSPCSENSSNTVYYDAEADACAYENLVCHGDKVWDEDTLWRDSLRRVSHRHARSMDDLDSLPTEHITSSRVSIDVCAMNSIKRIKKDKRISRNVTYVNCEIQDKILKRLQTNDIVSKSPQVDYRDENDVYVSLAENVEVEPVDEGVYEQLAMESSDNSLAPVIQKDEKVRKKFEIDREKLRQWDLMSSGLMKGGIGGVRGTGRGAGEVHCSTDSGADSASIDVSMTISGANMESNANTSSNQAALSKKAFLGSNTSIGRNNRDANIPVRAVSPRVRWVEEKPNAEQYDSRQMSISQQNLHTLTSEEAWASVRSPSRASQQLIRAVSPRIRRNTDTDDMQRRSQHDHRREQEIPTAGELLGRTHEELVLLLIQLRRRHAATHRAIEQCCQQMRSLEDCLGSLKAMEREESLQRLDQLKMQLMELEHQYQKSKPLVQLVDNMVKLGSLYNRPMSAVERLERNQRLRQKVLAEHAYEQQRWLECAAAGKPLETEAARARVAELWALEQELADEAAILQGLRTDKDAIESLLSGVRNNFDSVQANESRSHELEAELARVHATLALNSKKLEQTVCDNARLERSLLQLRRALHAHRQGAPVSTATAALEDEVSRVQQLVAALQRQRQELSRAVQSLTQQSRVLQTHHATMPQHHAKQPRAHSSWHETNLDAGTARELADGDYDLNHYALNVETPLYVDTRADMADDMQGGFANLSNVEKQEIKTVRIVKRESERRQRDRERSLQPMPDSPSMHGHVDQYLAEEYLQSNQRAASVPRTDFSKFEEYYSRPEPSHRQPTNMDLSPKFPSSPSLSTYDFSRDISMGSSYSRNLSSGSNYMKSVSVSNQYLNSPTESDRTLTNDVTAKSSVTSLSRSHMELSPIFKSEAAKQIITEMSGDGKNGSLRRRQVPKEKRRHNTAPHHLSAKSLSEMPMDAYNQDKLGRSLDDADMELALRAPPDVVRSALPPQRFGENTIDQLLAAPEKILIPERYIPEKPPELSPEEQQKRKEKVESIKKMLSSSSADPNKSPDEMEKRHREHLLQMNQILAKQVTEMSKIIAVKALEELPLRGPESDADDVSPDVELPIFQQRENLFT